MSARDVGADITRLTGREPGYKRTLGPAKAARGVAEARGVALAREAQESGGNGVVFDEESAALREYWPRQIVTTTDGLFTFEVEPIRSITMVDKSQAFFADPAAEPENG